MLAILGDANFTFCVLSHGYVLLDGEGGDRTLDLGIMSAAL